MAAEKIFGYPVRDPSTKRIFLQDGSGAFTFVELRETSKWPLRNSALSTCMHSYSATIDGFVYSGRGCGESMSLVLTRGRKAPAKRFKIVSRRWVASPI